MESLSVVICLALDHRSSADGRAKFKACVSRCSFVDTTLEVAGAFDLIVQGRCASLAEYTEQLERLRPQLAEFVTRMEANFVSRRVDQKCADDEADTLWLPCEDGHRRVDARLIDKVVAEGDYMRVHMTGWSCLVHSTMRRLAERLGSSKFIQLHRSTLVRTGFIDRLIHDQRGWQARLRDGTAVKVARSHVRDALKLMTAEPRSTEADMLH